MKFKIQNRKTDAFTLAEVLITLAIIGVVAALTLPTLFTQVTDKQFETASTSFQRKFGEALRVMNTQNELGGYSSTETFVSALSRHMKILKTCDNEHLTDCFTEEVTYGGNTVDISEIKQASFLGKDWTPDTNVMGLQFVNGVSALLAYNTKCEGNPFDNNYIKITGNASSQKSATVSLDVHDCVSVIYDVNSNSKPNTISKTDTPKDIALKNASLEKVSCFATTDNGVCVSDVITSWEPIDCSNSAGEDYSYCNPTPSPFERDYWAGAKRYCEKELDMKLPEKADLVTLMKDDNWTGKPTSGYFWSASESNNGAAWRVDSSGGAVSYAKSGSAHEVLCVGK